MVKINIPRELAPVIKECGNDVVMEWEANAIVISGKKELTIPFRIHLERYSLDTTKFKLIDYKSTKISSNCPGSGEKVEANLLFDDDGRTFGIFMENVTDRYLFQHSPDLKNKEDFIKQLKSLEYVD
ncbi:MAG: hypothetical protein ACTSVI_04455 [Promethearchaeota archaeon]